MLELLDRNLIDSCRSQFRPRFVDEEIMIAPKPPAKTPYSLVNARRGRPNRQMDRPLKPLTKCTAAAHHWTHKGDSRLRCSNCERTFPARFLPASERKNVITKRRANRQ